MGEQNVLKLKTTTTKSTTQKKNNPRENILKMKEKAKETNKPRMNGISPNG